MLLTSARLGGVAGGFAHASLLTALAFFAVAFLFRAAQPAAAPALCAAVSCETVVVWDAQSGGFQSPPPCLNHGCSAGCSAGASGEGGGWQTCKCGGQVEPRCCHLIYMSDGGGGYDVSTAGTCSASQGCGGGTCIPWFEGVEEEYFEITALCAI